jgi:hypothetical protein
MIMITQSELKDMFDYDPVTGHFTNRYSRGRAAQGARAGSDSGHGYRKICIGRLRLYEHHLAWLFVHNEWPEEIDHINGNTSDNRIANLRVCTRSQNNFNKAVTTLSGAYLDKRNLKWYSKLQVGGQTKFLGNFSSAQEAHEAYIAARNDVAGEFAYHNRPQLGGL